MSKSGIKKQNEYFFSIVYVFYTLKCGHDNGNNLNRHLTSFKGGVRKLLPFKRFSYTWLEGTIVVY